MKKNKDLHKDNIMSLLTYLIKRTKMFVKPKNIINGKLKGIYCIKFSVLSTYPIMSFIVYHLSF